LFFYSFYFGINVFKTKDKCKKYKGKSKKLQRSPPSPEALAGGAETPAEQMEHRGKKFEQTENPGGME